MIETEEIIRSRTLVMIFYTFLVYEQVVFSGKEKVLYTSTIIKS